MIELKITNPEKQIPKYPFYNPKPILIDQYLRILDGHSRYYNHLFFGVPISVEQVKLSLPFFIGLDSLVLTYTPFSYDYSTNQWKQFFNVPIIAKKDNGFYIVTIGCTRAKLLIDQNLTERILAQEII